jgi:hypothetical protein
MIQPWTDRPTRAAPLCSPALRTVCLYLRRATRPCPTPRSLRLPHSASLPPSRRARSLLPPVARATYPAETRPVLVVLIMVVLARCRWCWWRSRVVARRRFPPLRLESTGPGLPYVAKRMFQVFQMFQRYASDVSYRCCNGSFRMLHMLQ